MVMTTNLVSVTLNVGSQNYTGFELATKLTSLSLHLIYSWVVARTGTTITVVYNRPTHEFLFTSSTSEFPIDSATMWKELGLGRNSGGVLFIIIVYMH